MQNPPMIICCAWILFEFVEAICATDLLSTLESITTNVCREIFTTILVFIRRFQVTLLFNNAGVVSGRALLDTPDHLIERSFSVNTLSHFWTVKAFLPTMLEKDHGHIISIASMAGYVGIPKLIDYCSSKFAAVGFDEALRLELEMLGADGVHTTVICPYFIQATGMFEDVNSR